VKELLRLAQPEPVDLPRLLFGHQYAGGQVDQRRIPSGKEASCPSEGEVEQRCLMLKP